jgi:hypothetical protein
MTKAKKSDAAAKTGLVRFPPHDLHPAPENDDLYPRGDRADGELLELAESINQLGIQDPIVISQDNYIISGHRRHRVATLLHLPEVPCVVEPISYRDDRARFLLLLRTYNRHRNKTADVLMGEAIFDAVASESPCQAAAALKTRRADNTPKTLAGLGIEFRKGKARSKITPAKTPMLQAALGVIEMRRDFWPLTVRQIHYGLLNDPPLKHASKPSSTYGNDARSYKDLTDLLMRARVAGVIDWAVIDDETRPFILPSCFANPGAYMAAELRVFLQEYWRDLQQSQPVHIEVVGEKNTVANIISPVTERYTIPLTLARGYASGSPRNNIRKRFRRSGKRSLTIVVVSDFDPEGEDIAESLGTSMQRDFDCKDVRIVKAALTHQQVMSRDLPPNSNAKVDSSRFKRFFDKYGAAVYELEALEPGDLQQLLRDAIESCMDIGLFNAEVESEGRDEVEVQRTRRRILHAAGPIQ